MVGSLLAERLLEKGHSVVSVDDFSLGTRRHLEPAMKQAAYAFIEADVSQPDWHSVLQGRSFDVLFHLAANSDISLGGRDPVKDLQKTFTTTLHSLMAAKSLGIPDFVFSSSSAVYGQDPVLPTPEETPRMHPVSIYGSGKLASEVLISSFVENFGLNAWIYRFGNVVGKRLTHGVIYDFFHKLKKTPDRLVVLGNGHQTKTYIDAEDCVAGMVHGLLHARPRGKTHSDRFQIFNLSSDGHTSVRSIAENCVAQMTSGSAQIQYGSDPIGWVGDVPKTHLDTSRMLALGWKPRRSSDEAVDHAIRDFTAWTRNG